jgi:hypothetical protein
MDLFRKSLEVPPPRAAQANPIVAQNTPWLANLHPMLRGNAVSPTYFYNIYFNIILPSMCISTYGSISFRISCQHFV